MPKSAKTPAAPAKVRACVRCRCTEEKACSSGCAWVTADVDLCDACLSDDEIAVAMFLHILRGVVAARWQKSLRAAEESFFRTLVKQQGGQS